jgi:hypothetical protein
MPSVESAVDAERSAHQPMPPKQKQWCSVKCEDWNDFVAITHKQNRTQVVVKDSQMLKVGYDAAFALSF